MPDRVITGPGEKFRDGFPRVEPFSVELVGDHALLGMDNYLSGHKTSAVARKGSLPADEVVLVDPLPRSSLIMGFKPLAVDKVHCKRAFGNQNSLDRFKHREIVVLGLEISE